MVQVGMSAGDGLQLKSVFVDCLNNFVRRIAGIDTDRALRSLAADNAGVLLKSRDRDFFDDHPNLSSSKNRGLRIERSIIPHRNFHHERFYEIMPLGATATSLAEVLDEL